MLLLTKASENSKTCNFLLKFYSHRFPSNLLQTVRDEIEHDLLNYEPIYIDEKSLLPKEKK